MQKKVFLRKGDGKSGGGRPPYVKYLLLAILGLSVAVVAASYLLNPKGRDTARKTLSEKPTVKKELPKPPEPAPGELPSGERLPGGLAAKPESALESLKPAEPAPEAPKLEPPAAPPPIQPPEPAQIAKPPEPAPLFPKSPGAPSVTPKAPPAPSLTQKAPPAHPAVKNNVKEPARPPQAGAVAPEKKAVKAPVQGGMFAVQVGCFKEKKSAEEVLHRLKAKGYDVELCPSGPGGAYAFSVVTRPVPTMSKASTLATQLKNEPKVSPTVIRKPAACGLDEAALKAAMKKPAAAKSLKKPATKQTAAAAAKKVKKQSVTAKKPQGTAAKGAKPATAENPGTVTPAKAAAAR